MLGGPLLPCGERGRSLSTIRNPSPGSLRDPTSPYGRGEAEYAARSSARRGGSRVQSIAIVNVVAELDDAVRGRPSGDVDPVQRHRRLELRILALARLDHVVD